MIPARNEVLNHHQDLLSNILSYVPNELTTTAKVSRTFNHESRQLIIEEFNKFQDDLVASNLIHEEERVDPKLAKRVTVNLIDLDPNCKIAKICRRLDDNEVFLDLFYGVDNQKSYMRETFHKQLFIETTLQSELERKLIRSKELCDLFLGQFNLDRMDLISATYAAKRVLSLEVFKDRNFSFLAKTLITDPLYQQLGNEHEFKIAHANSISLGLRFLNKLKKPHESIFACCNVLLAQNKFAQVVPTLTRKWHLIPLHEKREVIKVLYSKKKIKAISDVLKSETASGRHDICMDLMVRKNYRAAMHMILSLVDSKSISKDKFWNSMIYKLVMDIKKEYIELPTVTKLINFSTDEADKKVMNERIQKEFPSEEIAKTKIAEVKSVKNEEIENPQAIENPDDEEEPERVSACKVASSYVKKCWKGSLAFRLMSIITLGLLPFAVLLGVLIPNLWREVFDNSEVEEIIS